MAESSKHKSRINLLEKARKILVEQGGKMNSQASFDAKVSTATNSSRKRRQPVIADIM
jgi:hypothetical protein